MEGLSDDGADRSGLGAGSLSESDVSTHLPGVTALLLKQTRDIQLARDLSQDVALAVVQAIREGRIRQHGALYAYMLQAARNLAKANRRKLKPELMETLPEDVAVWQDHTPPPEDLYEREQLRQMVLAVLDDLPMDRDRRLLRGHYVDELSKPELMHLLQMDADLFDKTLFRARQRMRDAMRNRLRKIPGGVEEPAPSVVPVEGKSRSA